MKIVIQLMLLFLFVSTNSCAQTKNNLVYKKLPVEYKSRAYQYYKIPVEISKKAYEIVKELPQGYLKDGSVDYTSYIQNAIDQNSVVVFPNFPVLVTGIYLKSNSTVIFQKDSQLILKPTDKERYQILALHGIENVKVYNPILVGDRLKHLGTTGEWGFGIDIRGSSNIVIYNPNVKNCWGDGIVVSKSKKGTKESVKLLNTENIEIYNAYLDYNRRNGISIIGVKGLKLVNPTILNSMGTLPQTAICLEPDNNLYELTDISIINPFTFNNNDGILIVYTNFLGKLNKKSNIYIENHIDYGSLIAFNVAGFKDKYSSETKPLEGFLKINKAKWINNDYGIIRSKTNGFSQKIELTKITVIDKSNKVILLKDSPILQKYIKDRRNFKLF